MSITPHRLCRVLNVLPRLRFANLGLAVRPNVTGGQLIGCGPPRGVRQEPSTGRDALGVVGFLGALRSRSFLVNARRGGLAGLVDVVGVFCARGGARYVRATPMVSHST